MALELDSDAVADCVPDDFNCDFEEPFQPVKASDLGVVPRERQWNTATNNTNFVPQKTVTDFDGPSASFAQKEAQTVHSHHQKPQPVCATQNITDEMIEDGAYVVFDWDNTLKLYDRETHQLSSRVSREFLLYLKNDRNCQLFIISAIWPSAVNLATILFEVEKLGLTDVFINASGDQVDGFMADEPVVKSNEYAYKGHVIICGYDKAETFLKLSSFSSARGDKVIFFDDEAVNIDNFNAIVPTSVCYLCE